MVVYKKCYFLSFGLKPKKFAFLTLLAQIFLYFYYNYANIVEKHICILMVPVTYS